MGLGLILIVVAVSFYYRKKFSWLNSFSSIGYPADSRFERSETSADEVIFNVTPARSSRGALIFIISGFLISLIPGIGIIGIVPLVMGLLVFPVGSLHRKPAILRITNKSLSDGDKEWSFSDIVAIHVRNGSSFNTEEPGQPVYSTPQGPVYGSKSTSVVFTKALGRRVVDRSYLVTLLTRQNSDESVLSGGLTLQCAEALRNSLTSEMAKHGHSI